jgi:hypothetical protein
MNVGRHAIADNRHRGICRRRAANCKSYYGQRKANSEKQALAEAAHFFTLTF